MPTCRRAGSCLEGTVPLPTTVDSTDSCCTPSVPAPEPRCGCVRCVNVTSKSAPATALLPPLPPPLLSAAAVPPVLPLPTPAGLLACCWLGGCCCCFWCGHLPAAGRSANVAVLHLLLTSFSQADASDEECSHAIVCQSPENLQLG